MNFLISILNGLSAGGTYAMIALGYTMVYGIAKMLNFAHGDIIMVGGYAMCVTLLLCKMPLLALAVAIVFCVLLGILIERVAYKPLRGASSLAVLITAIGVSYLLQSLAQLVFGSAPRSMAALQINGMISLGSLKIAVSTLITLVVTVVIMVALSLFIKY